MWAYSFGIGEVWWMALAYHLYIGWMINFTDHSQKRQFPRRLATWPPLYAASADMKVIVGGLVIIKMKKNTAKNLFFFFSSLGTLRNNFLTRSVQPSPIISYTKGPNSITHHMDIATYRLNRPRGRCSENGVGGGHTHQWSLQLIEWINQGADYLKIN